MIELVKLIELIFDRNFEGLFRKLDEIDMKLKNYLIYVKIEDIKWFYIFGEEDEAYRKAIELIKILNKDEKMNCNMKKLRVKEWKKLSIE
jgi:hypothetical protein